MYYIDLRQIDRLDIFYSLVCLNTQQALYIIQSKVCLFSYKATNSFSHINPPYPAPFHGLEASEPAVSEASEPAAVARCQQLGLLGQGWPWVALLFQLMKALSHLGSTFIPIFLCFSFLGLKLRLCKAIFLLIFFLYLFIFRLLEP